MSDLDWLMDLYRDLEDSQSSPLVDRQALSLLDNWNRFAGNASQHALYDLPSLPGESWDPLGEHPEADPTHS